MKILHKDSLMSEWDAEAKRRGVASGAILRERTLLADEILMSVMFREERRERMQKANQIARARIATVLETRR